RQTGNHGRYRGGLSRRRYFGKATICGRSGGCYPKPVWTRAPSHYRGSYPLRRATSQLCGANESAAWGVGGRGNSILCRELSTYGQSRELWHTGVEDRKSVV